MHNNITDVFSCFNSEIAYVLLIGCRIKIVGADIRLSRPGIFIGHEVRALMLCRNWRKCATQRRSCG